MTAPSRDSTVAEAPSRESVPATVSRPEEDESDMPLCNRSFWWRLCVLSFGFRIFCWYRGFCHRTGSDLLLFVSDLEEYILVDEADSDGSNDETVQDDVPKVYDSHFHLDCSSKAIWNREVL